MTPAARSPVARDINVNQAIKFATRGSTARALKRGRQDALNSAGQISLAEFFSAVRSRVLRLGTNRVLGSRHFAQFEEQMFGDFASLTFPVSVVQWLQ